MNCIHMKVAKKLPPCKAKTERGKRAYAERAKKAEQEDVYLLWLFDSVIGFCGGKTINHVRESTSAPMDYNRWPARYATPKVKDIDPKDALKAILSAILIDYANRPNFGSIFFADKKNGPIQKYLIDTCPKEPFELEVKAAGRTVRWRFKPTISPWYVNYNHGNSHQVRHAILIVEKL